MAATDKVDHSFLQKPLLHHCTNNGWFTPDSHSVVLSLLVTSWPKTLSSHELRGSKSLGEPWALRKKNDNPLCCVLKWICRLDSRGVVCKLNVKDAIQRPRFAVSFQRISWLSYDFINMPWFGRAHICVPVISLLKREVVESIFLKSAKVHALGKAEKRFGTHRKISRKFWTVGGTLFWTASQSVIKCSKPWSIFQSNKLQKC